MLMLMVAVNGVIEINIFLPSVSARPNADAFGEYSTGT